METPVLMYTDSRRQHVFSVFRTQASEARSGQEVHGEAVPVLQGLCHKGYHFTISPWLIVVNNGFETMVNIVVNIVSG